MKKIFLLVVAHACAMTLLAQGSVQLGTGAYVNSSGGGYLVFDNVNVVNNGSVQQAAGAGFVKLTGSANVSLSGTGATTIDELQLAKSGGSTLSLLSNVTVVSKVNFSGGLLNLNSSVLDLGSTGIFSNESEASRAFTAGSGYAQASGILNAPNSIDLGHLGAVISSSANMGSTIVRRGHAVQSNVFGSNNSIQRYYDIVPANNVTLKAVLRFYYFDAELNGIPESNLYQWKSKDNINWDFVGADARDGVANYVEKKSINKFDRFTLAFGSPPMLTCPANMTVSANQSGCKALVSFGATATGIPSPIITYSIGNKTITSPNVFPKGTTTVTATASNGILPNATCTFNVTVVCGQSAYTIAQVNGREERLTRGNLSILAHPNPSTHRFTLTIKTNNSHPVTVRIMDMLGREISVWSNINSNSTLSFGEKYLPGVYFVQVTQDNQLATLKLIKQYD